MTYYIFLVQKKSHPLPSKGVINLFPLALSCLHTALGYEAGVDIHILGTFKSLPHGKSTSGCSGQSLSLGEVLGVILLNSQINTVYLGLKNRTKNKLRKKSPKQAIKKINKIKKKKSP